MEEAQEGAAAVWPDIVAVVPVVPVSIRLWADLVEAGMSLPHQDIAGTARCTMAGIGVLAAAAADALRL